MEKPASSNSSNRRMISLEQIWIDLEKGIKEIYQQEKQIPLPRFMQLSGHVYNYCTSVNNQQPPKVSSAVASTSRGISRARFGAQQQQSGPNYAQLIGLELYNRIKGVLQNYVNQIECKMTDLNGEDLLIFYAKEWENFQNSSKQFNGTCAYLNRHWLRTEMKEEGRKGFYEIYSLAIVIWRDRLFARCNTELTNAALQLVESERNGKTFDSSLIPKIINCYIEMGFNPDTKERNLKIYKECFENHLLEATEQFYTRESENIVKNSVTEYMKHIEQRLNEEKTREQLYLNESVNNPLVTRCVNALISNFVDDFRAEFQHLLGSGMNDDLVRMQAILFYITVEIEDLKTTFESLKL